MVTFRPLDFDTIHHERRTANRKNGSMIQERKKTVSVWARSLQRLGLGLSLLLLPMTPIHAQVTGDSPAQLPASEENVATETTPNLPPVPRRRIIDAPVARPWGLKIVDAIKYPFHIFGNGLNRGARRVEEDYVMERAAAAQALIVSKGYEPLIGAMGTGSGFSFGVNFVPKKGLPKNWRLEFPVEYSSTQSAHVGAHLTIPVTSSDKLVVRTGFDYLDRTQVDFFGFGSQRLEANRSNFRLEKRETFIALEARPHPKLTVGFPVRLSNSGISEGEDSLFPTLQQQFDVTQIPGSTGADLLSFGSYLEWDNRDNPTLPRAGSWIRLEASYFEDTGRQNFRFMRYGLDAVQYLPLDAEHGIVGRTLIVVNDEKGGSAIPLGEKVILGGQSTLRGFREFRFQEDNALVLTLEYRWQVWQFADMILFFDEGQVASEPGDFSISRLRSSRGIGFRFRKDDSQILRLDAGHSLEGWRWYLNYQMQI